jgi:hypothetical protein
MANGNTAAPNKPISRKKGIGKSQMKAAFLLKVNGLRPHGAALGCLGIGRRGVVDPKQPIKPLCGWGVKLKNPYRLS